MVDPPGLAPACWVIQVRCRVPSMGEVGAALDEEQNACSVHENRQRFDTRLEKVGVGKFLQTFSIIEKFWSIFQVLICIMSSTQFNNCHLGLLKGAEKL